MCTEKKSLFKKNQNSIDDLYVTYVQIFLINIVKKLHFLTKG